MKRTIVCSEASLTPQRTVPANSGILLLLSLCIDSSEVMHAAPELDFSLKIDYKCRLAVIL